MYQVFLSVLVLFWYGNEGFLMIYHLFPPFLSPLFYRGKKKHKNKRNQPDFSLFLLPFFVSLFSHSVSVCTEEKSEEILHFPPPPFFFFSTLQLGRMVEARVGWSEGSEKKYFRPIFHLFQPPPFPPFFGENEIVLPAPQFKMLPFPLFFFFFFSVITVPRINSK